MSKTITVNNQRGHPQEFQQIISDKSRNFVGRKFVFTAINKFLQQYDRGYFTIIGAPGSGKSAIIAKYITENPETLYYNTQNEGKNIAEQFLTTICTQLIEILGNREITSLPENATQGSWFFSLLLQKISTQLEPQQRLIIAIDCLNEIDLKYQSPNSNILYLPRYIPEKIYFLLPRRPFFPEKSGLLIEAPSQTLNLKDYPQQNQADIQSYIRQFVNNSQAKNSLKSWLNSHHLNEAEFIEQLTAKSENNFLYISQILAAITQEFYPDKLDFHQLPPSLETYYQKHYQKMLPPNPSTKSAELISVELKVLNILSQQEKPISVETIATIIDEDEYEIETVLENWLEFLQQENIEGENCYRFYHVSFCDWLRKLSVIR